MILTDKRILEEMDKGTIKIEPYNRADLGSNSYDVHLGKTLAVYVDEVLDAKNTIRSNILIFRMKDMCLSRTSFTSALHLSTRKHMPTYLFWKENPQQVDLVSTFMQLQVKVM